MMPDQPADPAAQLQAARAHIEFLNSRIRELTAELKAHRSRPAPLTLSDAAYLFRVLEFEEFWQQQSNRSGKEDAIRRGFDVTPARYTRYLLDHLERPEVVQHNPALVRRLREQRDRRRAEREARLHGTVLEAGEELWVERPAERHQEDAGDASV